MGQENLELRWHWIKLRILKQNDHYVTVKLFGDRFVKNSFIGQRCVCLWGLSPGGQRFYLGTVFFDDWNLLKRSQYDSYLFGADIQPSVGFDLKTLKNAAAFVGKHAAEPLNSPNHFSWIVRPKKRILCLASPRSHGRELHCWMAFQLGILNFRWLKKLNPIGI